MKQGHRQVSATVEATGERQTGNTDIYVQYDSLKEAIEALTEKTCLTYVNRYLWITAGNQARATIRTSGNNKKAGKARKTSFIVDK